MPLAQLTLLARVGAILGSGLRRQETLERVADLLVPGFAAWCAIDLVDDDGELQRRVCRPEAFPSPPPDAPHGPAIVLRTGEPELVREITEDHCSSPPAATGRDRGDARDQAQLGDVRAADRRRARARHDLAARHRAPLRPGRPRADVARSRAGPRSRSRSTAAAQRSQMLFEASPTPMWVYDADIARLPRRQRRRDPPLRLLPRGVPGDDDQGHPPARGGPAAARRRRRRRRARARRRPRPGGTGARTARSSTSRSPPAGSTTRAAAPRSSSRTTSASASGSSAGSPTRRRWRRSAASPAASRTTSTTC